MDTTNQLAEYTSYYCIKCEELCHLYEQGLCCNCDQPWITEVIYVEDYPEEWVEALVVVTEVSSE